MKLQSTFLTNMKTLNTDDIWLRNLAISILDLLNSEIKFTLARGDTKEIVEIPFYYNYGTDEGFLKDFYIGLPNNCNVPVPEGTYDPVPRGIITITSFQVMSSDITNKFVRGSYTGLERNNRGDNVAVGYSAQLFSLPMQVRFDVKVVCDNLNKTLKVAEEILKLNYSNRVVYFQYGGTRIPAQIQFPEQEATDKQYKFTYADNNKVNLSLQLTVESYLPSFEETSNRKASNVMERILLNKTGDGGENLSNQTIDQNS